MGAISEKPIDMNHAYWSNWLLSKSFFLVWHKRWSDSGPSVQHDVGCYEVSCSYITTNTEITSDSFICD